MFTVKSFSLAYLNEWEREEGFEGCRASRQRQLVPRHLVSVLPNFFPASMTLPQNSYCFSKASFEAGPTYASKPPSMGMHLALHTNNIQSRINLKRGKHSGLFCLNVNNKKSFITLTPYWLDRPAFRWCRKRVPGVSTSQSIGTVPDNSKTEKINISDVINKTSLGI